MANSKVTTVVTNQTTHGYTMMVVNRNHYSTLVTLNVGDEYRMRLDVNWTYQEFCLENQDDAAKRFFISSDECCDYESITIEESDGGINVTKVARKHYGADSAQQQQQEEEQKSTSKCWRFWLWLKASQ
uniref:DUF7748 domain-containing protein n=1 Tax=Physcomitrium patens TaxID=3218 RepID=A0A2K1IYS1_PHYPA|nr:hypothetical protein PHYPA_024242 [Physcomitrium patens]